jgi:hypothetical protein
LFEIFSFLQTQLKFNYTLIQAKDKTYGILDASQKWTGMIGMINRSEADFTISALSRTYDREQVSTFTS